MPKKDAIEIIYQDADILVINKPTGFSVTKDRSEDEELMPVLIEQLGLTPQEKLLLVHRLDKETSGVMILAKNTTTQRQFSSYFTKSQIKKTYLALVSGAVTQDEGTIDAPIGSNRKDPRLMGIDFTKRGKKAVTNWRLLADFGSAALLAVEPITGRTHQIRVHLPSMGMPLTIDPLYGNSEGLMLSTFKSDYRLGKWQEEKPLIERLTLHAYPLQLPSEGDRPAVFTARLDKKFAATIKMLSKHNTRGPAAFKDPDILAKILEGKPL
jgi:23S rRNA pseudouridine1911/1915/1917 synthase